MPSFCFPVWPEKIQSALFQQKIQHGVKIITITDKKLDILLCIGMDRWRAAKFWSNSLMRKDRDRGLFVLNRKEVFGLVLHWYITFNTPQQIVQPQNVHRHTTFIYAFLADTLHHAVSVQDMSPVMLVLNFHVSCFSQCRTQVPVLSLTTHTWLEFHPCIKKKFPNGKSYEKFFVLRSWSHRKKNLRKMVWFFVFIWLIFFFPFPICAKY